MSETFVADREDWQDAEGEDVRSSPEVSYAPRPQGYMDPHLRVACARRPVAKLQPNGELRYMASLPAKWITDLEQNQQIASCCRHPENHTIGAYYSSAADEAKGVPDIYIFQCTCGRVHRRFMLGSTHAIIDGEHVYKPRPFWEVR